jgi:hypothetical protein
MSLAERANVLAECATAGEAATVPMSCSRGFLFSGLLGRVLRHFRTQSSRANLLCDGPVAQTDRAAVS